ncbi:hypothetical protein CDIF29631_03967 (plasmid) [Clostridioides difficile]|nr:Uncharacterised protein [Clostridioides difficile]STB26708.1 Uncharacterised protein [Clostridioides difficile]
MNFYIFFIACAVFYVSDVLFKKFQIKSFFLKSILSGLALYIIINLYKHI